MQLALLGDRKSGRRRISGWLPAATLAAIALLVGCASEPVGPANNLAFVASESVREADPVRLELASQTLPDREASVNEPAEGDPPTDDVPTAGENRELPAGAIPPVRGADTELTVGQQWSVSVQVSCNLGWITDGGQRSWRVETDDFTTPTAWSEAADENGHLTLIAELESADVAMFRAVEDGESSDLVRYRRTPASISC